MLLAIDIGNSRIKLGMFDQAGSLLDTQAYLHTEFHKAQLPDCRQIILASVANEAITSRLIESLPEDVALRIAKSSDSYQSLTNLYDAPQTLGIDRWASIIAAWRLQNTSCLVVNAGTAITVDAIRCHDGKASFIGGWISAGLRTMQQNLAQNTAQLTNTYADHTIDSKNTMLTFGLNTQSAVNNGTMSAAVGMIQQGYQLLCGLCKPPIKIVICGGDANNIATYCTAAGLTVEVETHLVLKGLYAINQQH